jgi:formylglycine-generating enzyme required for sulfatase activity
MRQTLILIAAMVALVGCGKKTTPAEPETNAEPKVAAEKQEPPKTEPKAVAKIPANAIVNTLGMKFVPVKGTDVQFCIWETRVKDYAAYAAANAEVDESWKKPFGDEFKQEDTHPVVRVNWDDANAFCEWLTKKELAEGKIKAGQKYRLPTDAEWSVAVGLGKEEGNTPKEKQMGVKDVYPWGNQWPPPKGAGNYYGSLNVDKFDRTAPVGSFSANQFGLHDMGGNVFEWCEDKYSPTHTSRVLRGASWNYGDYPDDLLSSGRYYYTPDYRNAYSGVGFRCVLVGGSGG